MEAFTEKPRIGKDVIETLTLGMYEDSRFIFREYVQNCADQIDQAVELGILKNRDEGQIDIMIDEGTRCIQILDNATGIAATKVASILGNIAVSGKDRTRHRGFRGIGRLGGLGYCNKLQFITSFQGEPVQSTLTWNAKQLREIINDRNDTTEAADLIRTITSLETKAESADRHYFKVILHDVSNDALLNTDEATSYLKMVAPIPFPSGFIYRSMIREKLNEYGESLDEFRVYVNTNQLFKSYSTILYTMSGKRKKSIDEIYDLEFREIRSDGELLAILWFGISKFERRLPPKSNPAIGIRIRKGNIQIGDKTTLNKFFKEVRGNSYFVGEVLALHPELIPNARRDFFVDNHYSKDLEDGLRNICEGELTRLYHHANTLKNAKKRIERVKEIQQEYEKKKETGFTNKGEKSLLEEEFEKAKADGKIAQKKIDSFSTKIDKSPSSLKKVMKRVVGEVPIPKVEEIALDNCPEEKPAYRTDYLSKLNRSERKFLAGVFEIIKRELPPDSSEALIQSIEEEYK